MVLTGGSDRAVGGLHVGGRADFAPGRCDRRFRLAAGDCPQGAGGTQGTRRTVAADQDWIEDNAAVEGNAAVAETPSRGALTSLFAET